MPEIQGLHSKTSASPLYATTGIVSEALFKLFHSLKNAGFPTASDVIPKCLKFRIFLGWVPTCLCHLHRSRMT